MGCLIVGSVRSFIVYINSMLATNQLNKHTYVYRVFLAILSDGCYYWSSTNVFSNQLQHHSTANKGSNTSQQTVLGVHNACSIGA